MASDAFRRQLPLRPSPALTPRQTSALSGRIDLVTQRLDHLDECVDRLREGVAHEEDMRREDAISMRQELQGVREIQHGYQWLLLGLLGGEAGIAMLVLGLRVFAP